MVSVAMLFPLGFPMGMLFPSGIAIVHRSGKGGLIPWLWAANGFCSVIGAIFAALFAMLIGFSKLLLLAAALYLVALLAIRRSTDTPPPRR